jgi:hypothetical protein
MRLSEFRRRVEQIADRYRSAVCPKCNGTGQVVNDGTDCHELLRR